MAETTVLGLFEEIDQAATALNRLKHEGNTDSQELMVLSSVPFPEGVLEADRSPIRLPLADRLLCAGRHRLWDRPGVRLGPALLDSGRRQADLAGPADCDHRLRDDDAFCLVRRVLRGFVRDASAVMAGKSLRPKHLRGSDRDCRALYRRRKGRSGGEVLP